ERAAVVFDLSWRHLSALAQEVFAALALAPGEDIGPNLVSAWLRRAPTGWRTWLDPRRWLGKRASPSLADLTLAVRPWLSEWVNASLLIPTDEQAHRCRYHDRVRDYALSKLTALGQPDARRRLLWCYAGWDLVRAEFDAVGTFALAGQYHRLRGWNAEKP